MIQKIPSPQQKFNDKPEQILIFLKGVRKIMHSPFGNMKEEEAVKVIFVSVCLRTAET